MRRRKEIRRSLWPCIDSVLSRLGGYAVSTVEQSGYVGTADADLREVEEVLRSFGFSFEVVSALKHRSCPDRRDVESGSWVLRDSPLSSHQLHVHLFSERDEALADLYAHYEKSWKRHPVEHYRVEHCDRVRGVRETKEILDETALVVFHREREERCML